MGYVSVDFNVDSHWSTEPHNINKDSFKLVARFLYWTSRLRIRRHNVFHVDTQGEPGSIAFKPSLTTRVITPILIFLKSGQIFLHFFIQDREISEPDWMEGNIYLFR